jgi:hypothetical protein
MRATALARAEHERAFNACMAQMRAERQAREKADAWSRERRQGLAAQAAQELSLSPAKRAARGLPILAPVEEAVATAPTWAENRTHGQAITEERFVAAQEEAHAYIARTGISVVDQALATTTVRAWEHTLLHGTSPDEEYLRQYHARVLFALENDLAVPDA